jgi:hypothetical protein
VHSPEVRVVLRTAGAHRDHVVHLVRAGPATHVADTAIADQDPGSGARPVRREGLGSAALAHTDAAGITREWKSPAVQ